MHPSINLHLHHRVYMAGIFLTEKSINGCSQNEAYSLRTGEPGTHSNTSKYKSFTTFSSCY